MKEKKNCMENNMEEKESCVKNNMEEKKNCFQFRNDGAIGNDIIYYRDIREISLSKDYNEVLVHKKNGEVITFAYEKRSMAESAYFHLCFSYKTDTGTFLSDFIHAR